MKISYIWIEKYRNLENFGLNLDSSNKFTYDIKNSFIRIKEIVKTPDNFFGKNIVDVTGIIGKNGSGKSNAIELICKSLKGFKSSLRNDFFIIINDNNKYKCYYSFTKKNIPQSNGTIEFVEYKNDINPLKVVFFSNVFDARRNDFSNEVSDISVNNLFRRQYFSSRKRITDFQKQIRFINSHNFQTLGVDHPQSVQFTSKVWRFYNSSKEMYYFGQEYQKVIDFNKFFRDRIREIKPENKFIHLFRYGFFFETIKQLLKVTSNINNSNKLLMEFSSFLTGLSNKRTDEITNDLMFFLEKTLEQSVGNNSLFPFDEKIYKQLNFLKDLKYILNEIKFSYNIEGSRSRSLEYFIFDYTSKKSKSFINNFTQLFNESNIFDINWLGISSGHKAYLNLFSSIYQELKYTKHNNLLLCIDEGDLYLHPKWQIEFFDRLLNILPQIFMGNIQLILSSHSPFLLSDLPNQNITILDQSIVGHTMNGIDLSKNTFGGNLYNLYSEPFFLGNKRISDFASKKIIKLINVVENKKEFSVEKKEEILKLVNLLGDDIIQYKIKSILNND